MTQTTIEQSFTHAPPARTAQRARLNAGRYTSREQSQREWESVWTRSWLFAGLVSDVAEPGDYTVFELGPESIVIVHGEDGDVRAFYNVCQHRGNRIFSSQLGYVTEVACPYHGWRYGLDGELREVPDAERFNPQPGPALHSLKPVRLDTWAGMLWVNMDPDCAPLAQYLGRIIDELTPYRFENMVLASQQTVTLAANWKTARDNFLEQYHVDFIHPQHATLVDCCNSTNVLWPYGHSATRVEGYTTDSRYPVPNETPPHLVPLLKGLGMNPESFSGRVADIRQAVQVQKRHIGPELGYDYAELSDDQLSDVWQYDIFPNTFMTVQAEEVWIFGPRPHASDPNSCYFDKWTLQVPSEDACDRQRELTLNPGVTAARSDPRPDPEVFDQADVVAGRNSMTITIDQDIQYLPDMQAGLHSRGFDHATLSEDEARVQHFHDWLDQWMRCNPLAAPENPG